MVRPLVRIAERNSIKRPFGIPGKSIWTISTLINYHTAREKSGVVAAAFGGISRARANAPYLPGQVPGSVWRRTIMNRKIIGIVTRRRSRATRMQNARRRMRGKVQESRAPNGSPMKRVAGSKRSEIFPAEKSAGHMVVRLSVIVLVRKERRRYPPAGDGPGGEARRGNARRGDAL